MTVGAQRRVIAVSAMTTFTLGFLGAAEKNETPSARFLIGIGFTFTFISIFSDLGAGDMAAAFAILIMISAVLYEGEDIINLLTQRTKGEVKAKKSTKKGAGKESGTEGIEGFEGSDGVENGAYSLTPVQSTQRLTRAQRPGRLSRR